MKKFILLGLTLFIISCNETPQQPSEPKQIIFTPVVVKKKYTEQSVTKDIMFGTGNWHSTKRYIVDINNKIWSCISQDDFIICDVGDTLWTSNNHCLNLSKKIK